MSSRTAPKIRSPTQSSRHNRDQVDKIILDLVEDCEAAFSSPGSKHRSRLLTQEPQADSTTEMRSHAAMEMDDMETRGRNPPRASYFHEEADSVPHMVDSFQTSKRSSFSRESSAKHQQDITDSAIEIINSKEQPTRKKSRQPLEGDAADTPAMNKGQPRGMDQPPTYPSPAKTVVIMLSLYISIFLVALDRTIIGPAIPAITNHFNSIGDIGWYGSAYMLTSAGFILLYGRIYTFFPTKTVFLSGIFLFEIGSAVCGAAQSSMMLIIGRAIAGLGSSGIFTGAILIMLNTVPLHKRPMLQGLFGACFGVASVAGPLLGGAFTGSKMTWRWCFYINLPLGGVTILIVTVLLKLEEQKPRLATWKDVVRNLDPLGTVLFLPSITCLLLALEWGAADYAWSSPRLIVLLIVFAVLFVAFIAWQYVTRHTTATVPARIIRQRSVAFGGASQFCVGSTMLTVSIYIPLWFQAIKGVSAMQSGINTIPLVLSVVVGSISSGGLVQKIGYYTPFMILGSCLMSIGTGLLTTWNMNTSKSMWIGYQIILGFGVGCTMQHPNLAIQVVLPRQDVPTGTAVLSLCQTLGGAVFTAVGQNLYIDKFSSALERIGGLDPSQLLKGGATDLTKAVPPALLPEVLQAYNNSLTKGTFFAALIIACLAVPAALGMEWRSVKQQQNPPKDPATGDEEKLTASAPGTLPDSTTEMSTTSSHAASLHESASEPPLPVRNPARRSEASFSTSLVAKLNPDLRDSLSART